MARGRRSAVWITGLSAGRVPRLRCRPAGAGFAPRGALCSAHRCSLRRLERRLVHEPSQEGFDILAVGDARCGQREIAARRIIFARKRRDQPPVAQVFRDHRQSTRRDTLPADGGLHDLVVEAKAQRSPRASIPAARSMQASYASRATACVPRDRQDAAAHDA